ncbi:uncharacterized protein LOC113279050 [Papaver somniferum]|uniref:uncharacterized protein LOC113279050 n=1 Tax=Papaver somniferum TaxID=3469 RepID=UPI000E6FF620|nr:uncharacterized protein LOC113279050 [Papaver somniferum]
MDCFVTSCMKTTFTDSISGDVLGLVTAREIWSFLEVNFQSQFMARKNLLKNQLHNLKKGNMTILMYLHNVKTIVDNLAAMGERVSNSDLVMSVLNGLGREFDSFVVDAQNRDVPFTFAELKPRLLNHKQWVLSQQQETASIFDDQQHSVMFSRNMNSGYNGKNKSKVSNGSNYFKSNSSFKTGQSSNYNQASSSGSGSGSYNGGSGNVAQQAFTFIGEEQSFDPSASTSEAPQWLADSGETAHITGNEALLQHTSNYKGKDKVQVGNGKSLVISSTGTSTIQTPKTSFRLNYVLLVPDMKHNLFSSSSTLSLSTTVSASSQLANSKKLPFQLSNSHATQPLSLIHCDVWGPTVSSLNGYKY